MVSLGRTLFALFAAVLSSASGGKVTFVAFSNASNPTHNSLHVELWRYEPDASGALLPLLKRDVFRTDGQAPAHELLLDIPPREGRTYTIPDVPDDAVFALLAYTCRRAGNATTPSGCVFDLSEIAPLGWAHDPSTCIGASTGSEVCATPLKPQPDDNDYDSATAVARVCLSSPTPFDGATRSHTNGRIWTTPGGRRVLRLTGTPSERGYAHGILAATQVMDMVRFFLLEDRALRGPGRGVAEYEGVTLRNLKEGKLFNTPRSVLEEAQGIVDGVRAANVSLSLPELGPTGARDMTAWDVVALSAYGQLFILNPQGDGKDRSSSCTQFVQSGDGPQYPIHARNMDGEVDVRKVTVSHVLLIAHDRDPEDAASLRFVSVMWPGFIGSFSAMNERGSSVQVNFGCPRPGPAAGAPDGNYSVDTQVVRDFVSHADNLGPADALSFLHQRHQSRTGGVIVQGILVMARRADDDSAFLYEGDSYGGAIRLPGNSTVRPNVPGLVMATNHFHKYRVDERQARKLTEGAGAPTCNGAPVSFSSMWRYKSGMGYVLAHSRLNAGTPLNGDEMRGALRSAVEGYTEHSIVFQPRMLRIAVAVASLRRPMWDAPYMQFEEIQFAELFDQ